MCGGFLHSRLWALRADSPPIIVPNASGNAKGRPMNAKVMRFYELVSGDIDLQGELNEVIGIVELSRDEEVSRQNMAYALAAFARAHGLDLQAEDLLMADEDARSEHELSEDELMAVAGGASDCICPVIGAANGCGCFFYGQGKDQEKYGSPGCMGVGAMPSK